MNCCKVHIPLFLFLRWRLHGVCSMGSILPGQHGLSFLTGDLPGVAPRHDLHKIQKSIMALSKGKTLLVIAHRLSTIQNADQIVVLKKGRIVDCGKQKELLKRCPLYADMWKAHIGAKNWSVSEKKEVAAHV